MRGTINLAGQPSGAVSLSVAYNVETDACVLVQVTKDTGETFDLLLSQHQAHRLAILADQACQEGRG